MNNTNNDKNKNYLYIGIFTLCVVVFVFVGVLIVNFFGNDDSSNSSNNNSTTTKPLVAAQPSEKGDQNAVLNTKINLRKIKFPMSIKQVKNMENKLSDTLDNPVQTPQTKDGYIYLSYKFNSESSPEFFGCKVLTSDTTSGLTYVFKDKQLMEVRIQYGALDKTAFDRIVSYNNRTYGSATYQRTFFNGAEEAWWKTKNKFLHVAFQDASYSDISNNNLIAYYRPAQ